VAPSHQVHEPQGAGSVRRGPKVSPQAALEKTLVTLRKVPATLALGLLASIIAHGGLFGGEHSLGGAYHALLVHAAFAGGLGLVLFFGLLAVSGTNAAVNGSVLAARLAERLPGYGWLGITASAWYAAAEYFEPHHAAASLIAIPISLAVASWLVQLLSRGVVALLADVVIGAWRAAFSPRTQAWFRYAQSPRPARRIAWTPRRFARPPPIGLDYCA
jgi:hypothetical protein